MPDIGHTANIMAHGKCDLSCSARGGVGWGCTPEGAAVPARMIALVVTRVGEERQADIVRNANYTESFQSLSIEYPTKVSISAPPIHSQEITRVFSATFLSTVSQHKHALQEK